MSGERSVCESGPFYPNNAYDGKPSSVVYLDEQRLTYTDPPPPPRPTAAAPRRRRAPPPSRPAPPPPMTGPRYTLNADAFTATPQPECLALRRAWEAGSLSPMLNRLMSLVPPPADREGYDWAQTQNTVGRELPADFKQLVDIYGTAHFANTFDLHDPQTNGDQVVYQTEFLSRELVALTEGEYPVQEALQLDPADVISWGGRGPGYQHIWHTVGEDPDQWPIILFGFMYTKWWTYHGAVTELITRYLTLDLTAPEIPDHWANMAERAQVSMAPPMLRVRCLPPKDLYRRGSDER